MKLPKELLEQLQRDLGDSKTAEDLLGQNGAIKKLVKGLMEEMLGGELAEHLGYDKHDKAPKATTNRRNGSSSKTIKSTYGSIPIAIPRDRDGSFDPLLIEKHQTDLAGIDEKVIAMYAKGMSTRDIQDYIQEIYGLALSPSAISAITQRVLDHVKEWQARPLAGIYPILYFDAIHFKVRSEGRVQSKAAYTVLGIDTNGYKDLLGIWIGESESAHFWMTVLSEMRNRGVEDIFIACIDGLKGFPEAIASIFPKTRIQVCIIHQIRHSLRYIAWKDQRPFMADLKRVYKAPTLEAAEKALDQLEEKWGDRYALVIKSWRSNWETLSTYFEYPEQIRRIIYTTNAVEALHRQFRKVTKTKAVFTHEDALRKLLFMAFGEIQKKWTRPIPQWPLVISQLTIIFKDRMKLDL